MMRLCCLSLSFKPEFADKQMDDLKFIDLCSTLELDGVDFNMSSLASVEKDHLKKVKKSCLEHGLSIACLGVSNDFGRPAEEQDAVDKLVRQGIDTAQFLGAPLVRLFAGNVRAGQTRDAVWKRAVEGLKRAAAYGEKAGVMIGLQNHNHTNITSTGEDVVRLLKDVAMRLCCPWYALVGDHDIQDDPAASRFRSIVGSPTGAVRVRGFRFLRLNTQEARPLGLFSDQIEWLEREFDGAAAERRGRALVLLRLGEGVGDIDANGRPEAGHHRVRGGGLLAHLEQPELAHLHPGRAGGGPHRVGQITLGHLLALQEDREEQDREERGEEAAERDGGGPRR